MSLVNSLFILLSCFVLSSVRLSHFFSFSTPPSFRSCFPSYMFPIFSRYISLDCPSYFLYLTLLPTMCYYFPTAAMRPRIDRPSVFLLEPSLAGTLRCREIIRCMKTAFANGANDFIVESLRVYKELPADTRCPLDKQSYTELFDEVENPFHLVLILYAINEHMIKRDEKCPAESQLSKRVMNLVLTCLHSHPNWVVLMKFHSKPREPRKRLTRSDIIDNSFDFGIAIQSRVRSVLKKWNKKQKNKIQ